MSSKSIAHRPVSFGRVSICRSWNGENLRHRVDLTWRLPSSGSWNPRNKAPLRPSVVERIHCRHDATGDLDTLDCLPVAANFRSVRLPCWQKTNKNLSFTGRHHYSLIDWGEADRYMYLGNQWSPSRTMQGGHFIIGDPTGRAEVYFFREEHSLISESLNSTVNLILKPCLFCWTDWGSMCNNVNK